MSHDGCGLQLFTDTAPDLSAARFCIDQYRLLDHGAELMTGPADRLEMLCDLLNASLPPDHEMPAIIREFIQTHGKGCVFTPGYRLVQIGRAAIEHRARLAARAQGD